MACIEIFNETAEAIDTGDIEESDIREFFEDRFKGNKSELKKIENMDFVYLANMYCVIVASLVDDDGEEVLRIIRPKTEEDREKEGVLLIKTLDECGREVCYLDGGRGIRLKISRAEM